MFRIVCSLCLQTLTNICCKHNLYHHYNLFNTLKSKSNSCFFFSALVNQNFHFEVDISFTIVSLNVSCYCRVDKSEYTSVTFSELLILRSWLVIETGFVNWKDVFQVTAGNTLPLWCLLHQTHSFVLKIFVLSAHLRELWGLTSSQVSQTVNLPNASQLADWEVLICGRSQLREGREGRKGEREVSM